MLRDPRRRMLLEGEWVGEDPGGSAGTARPTTANLHGNARQRSVLPTTTARVTYLMV